MARVRAMEHTPDVVHGIVGVVCVAVDVGDGVPIAVGVLVAVGGSVDVDESVSELVGVLEDKAPGKSVAVSDCHMTATAKGPWRPCRRPG